MSEWNPASYLKFADERTQPARDLASRMYGLMAKSLGKPEKPAIMDLGCGPGNSTQVLAEGCPSARLTGLDSSPAMIEAARRTGLPATWVCQDANTWRSSEKYHAIFSNAALQWLLDQAAVLRTCFDSLHHGGVLAIQVPGNGNSGLHRAMHHTASRWPRSERFAGLDTQITYHEPDFFYEKLCVLSPAVQVWETSYWHVLENYQGMIDWYAGTGLRPWLQALDDDDERQRFCTQMLQELRQVYTARADGKVYFPFRRIFATAVKPDATGGMA